LIWVKFRNAGPFYTLLHYEGDPHGAGARTRKGTSMMWGSAEKRAQNRAFGSYDGYRPGA